MEFDTFLRLLRPEGDALPEGSAISNFFPLRRSMSGEAALFRNARTFNFFSASPLGVRKSYAFPAVLKKPLRLGRLQRAAEPRSCSAHRAAKPLEVVT